MIPRTLSLAALAALAVTAGCGSDDQSTTAAEGDTAELAAVKDYLVAHAEELHARGRRPGRERRGRTTRSPRPPASTTSG